MGTGRGGKRGGREGGGRKRRESRRLGGKGRKGERKGVEHRKQAEGKEGEEKTYNIGVCSSPDERDHTSCIPRQIEGVPALVPIPLPNKPEVKGRTSGEETLDQLTWSS